MAVPIRSQAYNAQTTDEVGDAITFALDDGNWVPDEPDSFEINILPPGFGLSVNTKNLDGTAGCPMTYNIFVRATNADGTGDWFPLLWTVNTVLLTTERRLYGLPLEYPATPQHPSGAPATIFVVRAGVGDDPGPGFDRGLLYLNDVELDGTAARYGPDFQQSQFVLSGGGDTFLRASQPGWEVIIDAN